MPRLDGIRALAVGGVLLTHFLPMIPGVHELQTGRLGVRVFFVLSGFLITRILLDYRARMPVKEAARTFYWRRFLRLAPPFYFAIAVCLILGLANMRQDWAWHALYLSNFLFQTREWVGTEPAGHLWSLAVEEQFYLIWFAVVVWLPRRWLLPAIIGAILLAPPFRALMTHLWGRPTSIPFSVMDSLAIGALIGWASLERPAILRAFGSWPAFTASAALLLGLLLLYPHNVPLWSAMALFGACFVALAARPETAGLDWLASPPLRNLGKISYGIYLYHFFFAPLGTGTLLSGVMLVWLSVAVAAVSWALIERPALSLKSANSRKTIDRASGEVPAPGRINPHRVDC